MATSLCVLSVTAAPDRLRGALRRWMVEPVAGLYVGSLSARIRDLLWEFAVELVEEGSVVMAFPAPDQEQRFELRTGGPSARECTDMDGLVLISFLSDGVRDPEDRPQRPVMWTPGDPDAWLDDLTADDFQQKTESSDADPF